MAWTLRRKVLVNFGVVVLILVVTGSILAQAVTAQFESSLVEQTRDITAEHVRQRAMEQLSPRDFTTNFSENEATYRRFFDRLGVKDVIRIKVWDLNSTVVFSDDKSIVGQAFPQNEELGKAYGGNVSAEIKPPVKPENVAETGYSQLMEVYVPIRFQGRVAGVIESYTKLDTVRQEIQEGSRTIWTILGLSLVAVVGALVFHLWSLHRSVIRPVLGMQAATQAVSRGSLEVRAEVKSGDEVGQLAASINAMLDEIQRLDKSKDEFVTITSHELRTPLAVVQGYAALLEEETLGPLNETQKEKVRAMLDQTRRLNDIVRTFLDLSAIRMGRLTVRQEPVKLSLILHVVAAHIRARVQEKSLQLNLFVPPELPPVKGDPERLSGVLINLLDNAIKHTPEGGAILVTAAEEDGSVHVQVADTGSGIPPYELHRVFERFYQVEFHSKEAPGSLGLGLAICKGIVEAHGGKIWAESREGRGTTIHFTLPTLPRTPEPPRKDEG